MMTTKTASTASSGTAWGESIRLEQRPNGFHVMVIDQPEASMNVFSSQMMDQLERGIERMEHAFADATGLIITSGKKGCFVAGADIKEMSRFTEKHMAVAMACRGQNIFARLAALPMPTLALIEGVCLGGGLELALACDWRLVAETQAVKLGLPEVKLGLVPGWGGTQRLPRVVGLKKACDLILSGRQVTAAEALKTGLADGTAPAADATAFACRWLQKKMELNARPARPKYARGRSWLERTRLGRRLLFRGARKHLLKKAGPHYPAPYLALEAIALSAHLPLSAGLAHEAELLGRAMMSPVSRSLIHVFHLTERARHVRKALGAPKTHVKNAGVLGAGLMGSGIAVVMAQKGIHVRLRDVSNEALLRGMGLAATAFDEAVSRRRMKAHEAAQALQHISPTANLTGFSRAQIVIEAVAENINIKRKVLQELAACVPDDCVIASNTSSLQVTEMAKNIPHPERVLGLHFFNPAYKMPLVEVVPTEHTSDEALARALDAVSQMGKTPVVVRDVPGFLVNRMLLPYLMEALYLMTEGTDPARIDRAMCAFGLPMGPVELIDQIGVGIAVHAARSLAGAYGERMQTAPLLDRIADSDIKHLFHKPGQPNERLTAAAEKIRTGAGVPARESTNPEIADRLLAVLSAEAVRCLEEGVVQSALDVDLASIFGMGFPPFRGGLVRWLDRPGGLAAATATLTALAEQTPLVRSARQRYGVPELMARLAEKGETLKGEG